MASVQKPNERYTLGAMIDPDALGVATHDAALYMDVRLHREFMAVFQIGAMVATSTVDCSVVQATSSSGTGVKAVTGLAATQLLAAGGDNRNIIINFDGSDIDDAGGFFWVSPRIVVGTAGSDGSAALFGVTPVHGPATDNASVVEIIN